MGYHPQCTYTIYRQLDRFHETHAGFIHHMVTFLSRRRKTVTRVVFADLSSHFASCFYYHQRVLLIQPCVCCMICWSETRMLMTFAVAHRKIINICSLQPHSYKSCNYLSVRVNWKKKPKGKLIFTYIDFHMVRSAPVLGRVSLKKNKDKSLFKAEL